MGSETIQRTDFRQRAQLVFVQRHSAFEIFQRSEGRALSFREQAPRVRLVQSAHHAQAETDEIFRARRCCALSPLYGERIPRNKTSRLGPLTRVGRGVLTAPRSRSRGMHASV